VDIVGASAGDGKHGKIVQKVRVAGGALDANRSDARTMLYINVPSYGGGARECDFYVGFRGSRPGVYTCGYRYRVGSAKISRSGSSIRYSFSPKAIGRPGSYEWAFVVQGSVDGTIEDFDRVPDDQVGMQSYRLR
jgi:hypothetical protein